MNSEEVMELIDGNLTIEKFMGFTTYYMKEIDQIMVNVQSDVPIYLSNWERIRFHDSWDWLMPVAKKCIDSYHDKREDIYDALKQTDIMKCWRACVAFIKWYNENVSK